MQIIDIYIIFELKLFHNPQGHNPESHNPAMQKFQNSKTLREEIRGLMGLFRVQFWKDELIQGSWVSVVV